MQKTRMEDIVVVIPGITGSVLQKDGKDIWAISRQVGWKALTERDNWVEQLKLNGSDDPEVEDLGDGIKATRLIEDAHLIPGLVKIDGYTMLSRLITENFVVEQGDIYNNDKPANFLKFPYDWRRDNRVTARLLKRLLDERLKQWREYTGNKNAKIIILAHSMGGLISRYYLEVLEGWRDCKALFTFGTSHRGSVDAVNYLANGYKQLFVELTDVLRSLPSVYQLLPRYPMLKVGEQYQRIAETPNLHNIVQERAKDALNFHYEIEAAVESHKDNEEYRKFYKTIPIVGIKQPTMQSASLVNGQIILSNDLPEGIDPLLEGGDGTVPYLSAIPIELSEEFRNTYIAERHCSLQNSSQILQQLLQRLKEMQTKGLGNIRGPEVNPETAEQSAISLYLDDIYLKKELIRISARVINFKTQKLKAEITLNYENDFSQNLEFQEQDNEWVLNIDSLEPGLYRLKVDTGSYNSQAPNPVHDLFEVIS
ncbi:lipase/acyltransferase domain-containing protein [Scytonema sp. PRP1]|uniref:lipase/acyltransferase domain-containing protein n=1 Tax=Scytonema sp. PRP1 TaxID=3120513 RepID=UPI00300D9A79